MIERAGEFIVFSILLRDFYEVQTNEILPSCLFTRCLKGKKKNIYLCSPLVRRLLSVNQERIKVRIELISVTVQYIRITVYKLESNFQVINSGVRVFVRCDKKAMGCDFRLAQEVSKLFVLRL